MPKLRNLDEVVFGLADFITRPAGERRRGDLAQAHIDVADLLRRFYELTTSRKVDESEVVNVAGVGVELRCSYCHRLLCKAVEHQQSESVLGLAYCSTCRNRVSTLLGDFGLGESW